MNSLLLRQSSRPMSKVTQHQLDVCEREGDREREGVTEREREKKSEWESKKE